jgi:DNA-directed RNA polymerase subunit alpha
MNRILEMPKWEKDEDVSTETYGRFVVEPLERGFGATIGNSLRRVLLSSLEGDAITSVRIEGVQHEFGTIPGVIEDVAEVVLNLKSIRLRLHGTKDAKSVQINATGKNTIAAVDIAIDEDIEILNPDQHILSLNQGAKLVMDIEIGRGRGYVPAEQNKRDSDPIGTIFLDSVFSPVEKVNFAVENARVGQTTDYDRLILEIWTNGGVLPEDALASASRILIKHFTIFVKAETDDDLGRTALTEEAEEIKKYLDKAVNELELSVRAANCLRAAKIATIADLVTKTEAEMLKYRNFGKKSLEEIKAVLNTMNLRFGMNLDEYQLAGASDKDED